MLDVLRCQNEVAVLGHAGRHRHSDLAERVFPQNLPEYDLEQFTPKPQYLLGFFAHPILVGDRFVWLLPLDAEEDEMERAVMTTPLSRSGAGLSSSPNLKS